MQIESLNRIRQIFCAVICASFMVSCMPKEPEYTDVAAKFLEMLQDRSCIAKLINIRMVLLGGL